ncbi:hypothetical protein BKA61DRAFT_646704 [Leptodontidium sp. MPI-SDFR-AT-0119]|nr:hypothetical protein BKA61DRAFT_646704 [Leptodontidium sp. MPI-SDFR-AT-0119]
MSEIKNFDRLFRLDGKVALVTGGERSSFPSRRSQKVIITARKAEGPEGIGQAVEKLNKISGIKGHAMGIPAYVSNEAEIIRLAKKIEQEDGKLDILVANTGATWGSTFEDAPDQASEKILNLNVRGVFLLAQNSAAGRTVPHTGENGTIMYAVSKAAATHLGKNLAIELGPRNITTNVVSPGFFPSKLASGLIDILGGTKELEEANPRKRLGEPDDIAGVMIYLCSPSASYINGVDISVDGGMMHKAGRFARL